MNNPNIYYYKIGLLYSNGKTKYFPELTSALMTKKEAKHHSEQKLRQILSSGWDDCLGSEMLFAKIFNIEKDNDGDTEEDDDDYGLCTPSNSFIEQFM